MTDAASPCAPAPRAGAFRIPAAALLAGFILAAAGGCFDFLFPYPSAEQGLEIQTLHIWLCCGFFALLLWADREGDFAQRLQTTLYGLAGSLVLCLILRRSVAHLPYRHDLSAARVFNQMLASPAPYLWAAALWFASPLLGGGGRRYSRFLRLTAWTLALFGALCFASAFASQWPERSFLLVARERALLCIILFAWLRAAQGAPQLRAGVIRATLWLLLALVGLGALVGLADLLGSAPLREELLSRGYIFLEKAPQDVASIPSRRLVFPMLHFNRTAYQAMLLALGLLIAQFAGPARRGLSRFSLLGLAPAFFVMVYSFTRGVTAAAVAGLCAWAALASRRALLAVVAGCLVVALLLPARQREHFASIFKPSTYRLDQGPMSSMKLRIYGWQYGLGVVVPQMPLAGLGYGSQIVKNDYTRYIKASGNARLIHDIEENATHQHMHNVWVEVAVESGLPALLAFVLFNVARWAMLGRALWRARGAARRRWAAWVGLEVALLVSGMVFYMYKQNIGLLPFFYWSCLILELDEPESGPAALEAPAIPAPKPEAALAR